MLGRKDYTRKELDDGKAIIKAQAAAYKKLVRQLEGEPANGKPPAALVDFETQFFNNLLLALDRRYVHRLRQVTGKDGNPLNEVELIVDGLLNNNGVFKENNVIKYSPDESVVKLKAGDKVRLSAADFDRLSSAFFADLERKFVKA